MLAILSAIVTNEVKGRLGALMMVFYLLNTLVAMLIGLTLTNLIHPGKGAALVEPGAAPVVLAKKTATELAPGSGPDEHRRAVHAEPPGAARRADARAGDRAGEDPRPAEGDGARPRSRSSSTCSRSASSC